MDRVPTYVEGFDEALGGGVPRGSVVLICGTPGTMKTSLAFSILYHNARRGEAKGLFIGLEESRESLRTAMAGLGMADLEGLDLYLLDVGRIRLEHRAEEQAKDWLEVITEYIERRVTAGGFELVALDSLGALYSISRLENPRRDLFHFFSFLKGLDATAFLISEIPHGSSRLTPFDEAFLADGLLLLQEEHPPGGDVLLRCVKMRRTRHAREFFPLSLKGGRFAAAPPIQEYVRHV